MTDLLKYTLRIADNSLILGQRMAEWCSKGPTLEEDIAMSNIALDLFGQANGFLEYASQIHGKKTPDDFAFKRNADEFFNFHLLELENKDFGNTMIRNLLYDTYYFLFYKELTRSNDKTLAALAEKSFKEIKYHLRHSSNWIIRLGDGTKESNKRVQESLNNLWKYTIEFFEKDDIDLKMIKENIGVDTSLLKKEWGDLISETLNKAKLIKPKNCDMSDVNFEGRHGKHSKYLISLLEEMQEIPRKYPDAKW
jgi:ring-1,2-phenylacetyl-CoA epoxidase subunit PaaC